MKFIGLLLLVICCNTIGQLSMKKGVIQLGNLNFGTYVIFSTVYNLLTSPLIVFGLTVYAVASILWLYILSKVELSYAYPMLSLGYITVVITSWITLHESLSLIRIAGVLLVCFGIFLISRS